MTTTVPKLSGDIRAHIPKLGLRNYWYPAVTARAVGSRKPVKVALLGEELCLFRGANGNAAAKLAPATPSIVRSCGRGLWLRAGAGRTAVAARVIAAPRPRYSGGRGVGVRGARRVSPEPLTPDPSPLSTGARGDDVEKGRVP